MPVKQDQLAPIDANSIYPLPDSKSIDYNLDWRSISMWLESKQTYQLIRYAPEQNVVRWQVDVHAEVDDDAYTQGKPTSFVVGRLLADEIRRYEVEEWGATPYEVAEGDSSGFEAAYAAILDENGQVREEDFDAVCDSIVYLYRFSLHEDFVEWRLPILDALCRQFSSDAVILAQHHTTWFSLAEFELLGFRKLARATFRESEVDESERNVDFLVRSNAWSAKIGIKDYPEECHPATAAHEQWLESKGPWKGLC